MVCWASLVAQRVKHLPAVRETRVRSLVREDSTYRGATKPVCHHEGEAIVEVLEVTSEVGAATPTPRVAPQALSGLQQRADAEEAAGPVTQGEHPGDCWGET